MSKPIYYRILRGQFFCGIPEGRERGTKDLMALYCTIEAAQDYIDSFCTDINAYHIEAVEIKPVKGKRHVTKDMI